MTLTNPRMSEFQAGLLLVLPVCLAAIPIGFLFGALSQKAGLSALEAGLMSFFVFAGASQFVALQMWDTPLPVLSIILATLLINLRHVFMGASLARRMGGFSRLQKLLGFYVLVDESWALAEARARKTPLTPAFYFGVSALFLPVWAVTTVLGNLFGAALGDPAQYGFDFVFNVIFIALIVAFRRVPGWLFAVIASALVAVLSYRWLPSPWYVLCGAVAGMAAASFAAGREAPAAETGLPS
jgi:4-azaleucine resistance transporter AzlC